MGTCKANDGSCQCAGVHFDNLEMSVRALKSFTYDGALEFDANQRRRLASARRHVDEILGEIEKARDRKRLLLDLLDELEERARAIERLVFAMAGEMTAETHERLIAVQRRLSGVIRLRGARRPPRQP